MRFTNHHIFFLALKSTFSSCKPVHDANDDMPYDYSQPAIRMLLSDGIKSEYVICINVVNEEVGIELAHGCCIYQWTGDIGVQTHNLSAWTLTTRLSCQHIRHFLSHFNSVIISIW